MRIPAFNIYINSYRDEQTMGENYEVWVEGQDLIEVHHIR